MSCILENNADWEYDSEFTALSTTTATKTINPNTTPETEDVDYCNGKKDGLYPHPDCTKYYQCYGRDFRV